MNPEGFMLLAKYGNSVRMVAGEYDHEHPRHFYTPIYVLSAIFGTIFVLGPLIVRKRENAGIIQTSIMLTAFTMWIFWVTIYIAQMNPLMGPRLKNTTLAWIGHNWGNPAEDNGALHARPSLSATTTAQTQTTTTTLSTHATLTSPKSSTRKKKPIPAFLQHLDIE